MFRHVLVPLDGIRVPKTTLVTAVSIVNAHSAKLSLLYVMDLAREFATAALSVISESDVERHELRIRNFLTDALAIVQEYGGACSTHVVNGSPVHRVINSVATELNVDIIAISTRDRRRFARGFCGSVTDDILRDAGVPVLVVHESEFKRRTSSRAVGKC